MKNIWLLIFSIFLWIDLWGQCSNCNVNNPTGTFSVNVGEKITVSNCVHGGDYAYYNVVSGVTYIWTTCQSSGFDTYLTLYQGMGCGGTELAYNNDLGGCGNKSAIVWTATFTGTVTLLVSKCTGLLGMCGGFWGGCGNTAGAECVTLTFQAIGTTCLDAQPFCTDSSYFFPMAVGSTAETGPEYGCLCSQPNPIWYYMFVDQPGDIIIHIYSPNGNDVDFIAYGPFNSLNGACNQLTGCSSCGNCPNNTSNPAFYPVGNVVDCSYDPASEEYLHIYNAQFGQYYLLLITNFEDAEGTLQFEQTGGTGAASCAVVTCNIDNFQINVGQCDPATNTYNVTGTVNFSGQPTAGQLIIKDNSGQNVTLNPPFTSPQNFNITDIQADGQQHYVVVYFSNAPTCTDTIYYTAPSSCSVNPVCDVQAGPDTTICPGRSVQLWATGADTYVWSPGTGLSNPNIANPVATPTNTTIYTVTGTVTATGCTDVAQVTVSVYDIHTITSANITPENCGQKDGSIQLNVNGGLPPYTYQWSNGGNSNPLQNISAGTYSVTVTDQHQCTVTGTYMVNQLGGPTAKFEAIPSVATVDNPVISFLNQSIDGTLCFWTFGDGTSSQECNPVHTYPGEGEYQVTFRVCNQTGCCDSTTGKVYVQNLFTLYIPEAFSPNEDGVNDYFYVYGMGLNPEYFDLAIYDRWGKQVFHTTDFNTRWDGTYNGKVVPEGCYVYKLTYSIKKDSYIHAYGKVCIIQ